MTIKREDLERVIQPKKTMKIKLNGSIKEVNDGITVKALLDSMKLNPETVAVELNLAIIPKNEYDARRLNEEDKIEIISFVGGG